jgi:HTH-type transcriptional regulator, transcriptional repressor of NAD biosynthesis genes
LAPHRALLGLTVCLIGPECTGKTTLAQRLAVRFGVPWVREFAREYALRAGRMLTFEDVEPIARGQMALEDAAANDGLIILDTDLISTVVYSGYYYDQCPLWIGREAKARKADLYLLTDIDVPWTADDVRDSAATRAALHREFSVTLAAFGARFVVIRGDRDVRFAAAVKAIDHAKARRREGS